MHNSDLSGHAAARVVSGVVLFSALAVACSTLPAGDRASSAAAAPECVGDAAATPQQKESIGTLRRSIETSPLYAIALKAGTPTCRVTQDDSATRLEYTFRDGTTLRVTRNPLIESTDQELRLASPLGDDPVALLTRAERASFGEKGCGINWRQPEIAPAGGDAGATDRIFRGETCNCQARARTDASGRVLTLSLRSTC